MGDNRFMCGGCKTVLQQSQLLLAPSPFDADNTLTACPRCKQCDEGFIEVCDEPACLQQAGCGWPTGDKSDAWGGYRRTCYQHMARVTCWCARCDRSANVLRSRMSLCPECGDKRCPRSEDHRNACSKPPNVEANRPPTARETT